jgi:hypothetical protein
MKIIFTVFLVLLVTACASPEEQRRYAEQERIQQQREQQRRAALSPSARCQEDADKTHNYCSAVECGFTYNFGASEQGRACRAQCLQQKSLAYQLCTYK